MAFRSVQHHAFVCGCGYGQAGDDGHRSSDAARGWDGKTLVMAPAGKDPVCPNASNHATERAKADAERLANLERELESLRARVGGSSSSVILDSTPAAAPAPVATPADPFGASTQ